MGIKSNAELLAALDGAFKSIMEVGDLGQSVLETEKADRFVREMQFRTRILPEARFINMQSKQRDIDRIGFPGRIISSGKDAAGSHRSLAEAEYVQPNTQTNRLITNELIAIASLRDDTLRENIERGNLEGTLLELFGQAAGRDFEEYAVFADKLVPYADDDMLSKTDGWIRKAANKLYGWADGLTQGGDFDETDGSWPENLFEQMLTAMPKQFLEDPGEMRFYVPWEIENAYRNILRARGTNLGDTSQTEFQSVRYKGIPVMQVPLFARATPVDTGVQATVERNRIEGRIALLTIPSNLVWGVFHQIQIEPEREAKERRTDFVITFEGDAHYEDENASVAALLDKSAP